MHVYCLYVCAVSMCGGGSVRDCQDLPHSGHKIYHYFPSLECALKTLVLVFLQ